MTVPRRASLGKSHRGLAVLDLAAHPCTVREPQRRQPQGDEAAIGLLRFDDLGRRALPVAVTLTRFDAG
jgi:hypothetical protein